ncbi:hypothetical protein DL98DRAFT_573416 [Cadophora sp. DSE1049]|nr:hypothetical protein DL98DRAFT_573416 [Cadophora sp. DSE1049]
MASPAMRSIDEGLNPAKENLAIFRILLTDEYVNFKIDSVPHLRDYTLLVLSDMQAATKLRVDTRPLSPSQLVSTEGFLQLIEEDINLIRMIASTAPQDFLKENIAQQLEARTCSIVQEMADEISLRAQTNTTYGTQDLDNVAEGSVMGNNPERFVVSITERHNAHGRCSEMNDISRVRLCLTVEDTELPYDHTLQAPSVEFHESLLLVQSTTIRTLLDEKQSKSARFDVKDKIAWDREVSKVKESFFKEAKGVYLDRLVMFAARASGGPFIAMKLQAQEAQQLSQQQLWQGVHTWIDWMRGYGIRLHDGTVDVALTVSTFLGARKEYLEQLKRYARYAEYVSNGTWKSRRGNISPKLMPTPTTTSSARDVKLWSSISKNLELQAGAVLMNRPGRTKDIIAENTLLNIETSDVRGQDSHQSMTPSTSDVRHEPSQKPFFPETSNIRGLDFQFGDESPPPQDFDQADFPFKYDSKTPRVRIYVTAEREDLPFDHPDQPLYLDLPEVLACEHSVLIKQALKHKRDPVKEFDVQDEMIWDPATSTTERLFPAPYIVLNLEEIILNLCNPGEELWVETPRNRESILEWTFEVKHLMLRNIGEFWDGMKTWKAYIDSKDIVLFSESKARENAIDVAIFLGALPAFVKKLIKNGGLDEDGKVVDLNPRRGRAAPPEDNDEEVPEDTEFEITDQRLTEDIERKKAHRPRSPQPPLSHMRKLAHVDDSGTSRDHMIYKDNYGHEGGPLSVTRANDTHQVIVIEAGLQPRKKWGSMSVKATVASASSNPARKRKRGLKHVKKVSAAETTKNAESAVVPVGKVKTYHTRNSTKMESVHVSDMDSGSRATSNSRAGWLRRSERPGTAKSYHIDSEDDIPAPPTRRRKGFQSRNEERLPEKGARIEMTVASTRPRRYLSQLKMPEPNDYVSQPLPGSRHPGSARHPIDPNDQFRFETTTPRAIDNLPSLNDLPPSKIAEAESALLDRIYDVLLGQGIDYLLGAALGHVYQTQGGPDPPAYESDTFGGPPLPSSADKSFIINQQSTSKSLGSISHDSQCLASPKQLETKVGEETNLKKFFDSPKPSRMADSPLPSPSEVNSVSQDAVDPQSPASPSGRFAKMTPEEGKGLEGDDRTAYMKWIFATVMEPHSQSGKSMMIKQKTGTKSTGTSRKSLGDDLKKDNFSSPKPVAQDSDIVATELDTEFNSVTPEEISVKIAPNAHKDGVPSPLGLSSSKHPEMSRVADVFDMASDKNHDGNEIGAVEADGVLQSQSTQAFSSANRPIEIPDDENEFDAAPSSIPASISDPRSVLGKRPPPTAPRASNAPSKRGAHFLDPRNEKSVLIFLKKEENSVYLEVSNGFVKADASTIHNILREKVTRRAFDTQDDICWIPAGSTSAKVYLIPFLIHRVQNGDKDAADLVACSDDELWWLVCHWARWVKGRTMLSNIDREGIRARLLKLANVLGASQTYIELVMETGR